MTNFGDYDKIKKSFSWSVSENELDYKNGNIINIGWYCSDRICEKGKAQKVALYYEGFGGVEKKYTFNDIRLASNTIGAFLRDLGIRNEERVCLFMDYIYHSLAH
jgi:acetyl-CoA synthetase